MGLNATPFLAKSASTKGLGRCPDLRRFADHSGGTVADFHGLPRFPCLLNVGRQFMSRVTRCQLGSLQSGDSGKKKCPLRPEGRGTESPLQNLPEWQQLILERPPVLWAGICPFRPELSHCPLQGRVTFGGCSDRWPLRPNGHHQSTSGRRDGSA